MANSSWYFFSLFFSSPGNFSWQTLQTGFKSNSKNLVLKNKNRNITICKAKKSFTSRDLSAIRLWWSVSRLNSFKSIHKINHSWTYTKNHITHYTCTMYLRIKMLELLLTFDSSSCHIWNSRNGRHTMLYWRHWKLEPKKKDVKSFFGTFMNPYHHTNTPVFTFFCHNKIY